MVPAHVLLPATLSKLPLAATPGPNSVSGLGMVVAPVLLIWSCELLPTVTPLEVATPPITTLAELADPGPAVMAGTTSTWDALALVPPNVMVNVSLLPEFD